MLDARDLTKLHPSSRRTLLDDVCRRAIVRARAGGGRVVGYVPEPGVAAIGRWDARALERALALLVEDALLATRACERVELRWRVEPDAVVVRIEYPRPIGCGERLVSFFDADAGEHEDRRRIVGARDAVLEMGGTLARVRTRRGTTYVVRLPRAVRAGGDGGAEDRRNDGEEEGETCVSLYVAAGPHGRERIARLVDRAGELLAWRCSRARAQRLVETLRELAGGVYERGRPAAVFASNRRHAAVVPRGDVPDAVVVGTMFDMDLLRAGAIRAGAGCSSGVGDAAPAGA